MLRYAFLSIKKNSRMTILLFIFMCVIINLIIVDLSMRRASLNAMNQIRSSLGSEVVLSCHIQNMMKNSSEGKNLDEKVNHVPLDIAEQLSQLDYVESYNYSVSVGVTSTDIQPIETIRNDSLSENDKSNQNLKQVVTEDRQPSILDENNFTVNGYTDVANVLDFIDENYVLQRGRLLTNEDSDKSYCIIEEHLANYNHLDVGNTLDVSSIIDDKEIDVTLTIVGIYKLKTANQVEAMMSNRQNPMNQIYTDLLTAQKLNNSLTEITTAIYSLDDSRHIEAFKKLAQSSTNIDFENYILDAHDQIYQKSISSLKSIEKLSMILIWIIFIVGIIIICLIFMLTMPHRIHELSVLLSLGQSKIRMILQQFYEVLLITIIAFLVSLGTGKIVSSMAVSIIESPQIFQPQENMNSLTIQPSSNIELDVSLTSQDIIQIVELTSIICFVSAILPSIYIFKLSPCEILMQKED